MEVPLGTQYSATEIVLTRQLNRWSVGGGEQNSYLHQNHPAKASNTMSPGSAGGRLGMPPSDISTSINSVSSSGLRNTFRSGNIGSPTATRKTMQVVTAMRIC